MVDAGLVVRVACFEVHFAGERMEYVGLLTILAASVFLH